MLRTDSIDVYYGAAQALRAVSMHVDEGEIVAVIGANGAGKTTLLKTISGVLRPQAGSIHFAGRRISGLDPDRIVAAGIVQAPEGRLLFAHMTVLENLEMGAYLIKEKRQFADRLDAVHRLFPTLKERAKQVAGTLSGGEQQMLAIGRALMSSPRMIMLDEPSLGLAPKLVTSIFNMVQQINKELRVTVLLVEQNVRLSCEISNRAFVLENGAIVLEGTGMEMLANEHVRRAYMGL